jgi:hypothetical protein
MHPALIVLEVLAGACSLAVWCELVPRRWWRVAAPRTFISVVCPEARCLGFAVARGEHLNRRVICKDGLS